MSATTQIGRIAFREEGSLWNAYYALNETMEGALFLGSIRMAAVASSRKRKQAFMDLMRDMVGDILKERIGHSPSWNEPRPAPESERGGSA